MEASSAINAPHPDDTKDDEADLFFGGDDEEPESNEDLANGETEADVKAEAQVGPTPEAQASLDALRKQRGERPYAPEDEPGNEGDEEPDPMGGEADPTLQAESAGPTEESDPTPSGDTTPPPGEGGGKKSGSLEREYVVLQKVPLSKRALQHLLKELEEGGIEPRVAYIELDRRVARNDKQALGEVFRQNRDSLGAEATLVGVSSRSFTERKVKPRQRPVEETFDIS